MFMTRELTHVRNVSLTGCLDNFTFKQGKLYINVNLNTNEDRYHDWYCVQITYNNCEDWHINFCESIEEVWLDIENNLYYLAKIVKNPAEMLEERIKEMHWISEEMHIKTIEELVGGIK